MKCSCGSDRWIVLELVNLQPKPYGGFFSVNGVIEYRCAKCNLALGEKRTAAKVVKK